MLQIFITSLVVFWGFFLALFAIIDASATRRASGPPRPTNWWLAILLTGIGATIFSFVVIGVIVVFF